MSIATVTDALAALERTIPGVRAAYSLDETPNTLHTLPAFINWPGAATYEAVAGLAVETRSYRCVLYVTPVQSPLEMRYKGKLAEPLLAAARDAFLGAAGLAGTLGVLSMHLTGDTGLVALEDYGGVYIGVEFTVQVQEHVHVTYKD
ncbi:MAG: hypothetical protein ACUVS6_13745 [Anaerolineae bacterium]